MQVLLRDPLDDNVIPLVEELQRRLALDNSTTKGQTGEDEDHPGVRNDSETNEQDGTIPLEGYLYYIVGDLWSYY